MPKKQMGYIKGLFQRELSKAHGQLEEEKKKQEEETIFLQEADANREKLRQSMLLTSCPSLEGYRIVEHLGLVFGEIAFKTGFFKSLGATVDNIMDYFSAGGDKELSGTSRLLADAREYAITKMKDEAINRKANAIVGIDSEPSVRGDIIHITIFVTSVVGEKE